MMKKRLGLILFFLLVVVVASALATSVLADQTTIKLAIWDYSMNPDTREVVESFQKDNPDIKVEVIDISSAEYINKMTVMLAAGEDIDAYAIKDFPSYASYVSRNYLAPLDSYVKKDKIDLKPYGQVLNFVKEKGKLMALPFRGDVYILYYNKDLFDKAGIPYPTNDTTWAKFQDYAKKITSGEGKDKIWGAFLHSWKSQVMNQGVINSKLTLIDGKYSFLKPSYQLFLKMQNEDKSIMSLAEVKTTSTHYRAFFETGKVGMVYMGTWYIGSLIADKKAGKHNVNWGIAKAPHWPGNKAGSTVAGITNLGINAKSSKKDATWKFLIYYTGEKGAKILAKYGVFPGLRTPEVLNIYTSAPGFPAEGNLALETSKTTVELPPSPFAAAIDRTLQEEHDMIMTGQKTLEQGLKDMDRRVKEIKEDE
jgi:multiple sugar transport system substrate-binding protein